MLDAVQAGAGGIHPAAKNRLVLFVRRSFIDFHKGGGLRRLGRWPGIADARRYLKRAKLHGLVNRHLK